MRIDHDGNEHVLSVVLTRRDGSTVRRTLRPGEYMILDERDGLVSAFDIPVHTSVGAHGEKEVA